MNAYEYVKQGIGFKQLLELGKFCFTAGTATLAFLAAAEKINAPSEWSSQLILASVLLGIATIIAAAMVVTAAPNAPAVDNASKWPTWSAIVWFLLWTAGAAIGLCAVLPTPGAAPASG